MNHSFACRAHKDPIGISHYDLESVNDDLYRNWCPACNEGTLLIERNLRTGQLSRASSCTLCSQVFWFQDAEINGEKFDKSQPKLVREALREIVQKWLVDPPTLWERLISNED